MSIDGKISSTERGLLRISDEKDLERVDILRAGVDAVVIGGKTLLMDNPRLTIRSDTLKKKREIKGQSSEPFKVVVTGSGNVPLDSWLLLEGEGRKYVFTTERADKEKIDALSDLAEVFVVGKEKVDFTRMLDVLSRNGVKRVMVEGGATLNFELIRACVVDEIHVMISPYIIGGKAAPTLVDGKGFTGKSIKNLELISCEQSGGFVLVKYHLQNHHVSGINQADKADWSLKEQIS
jgi:2,5-diamino-6-(ribosylamino)-4(3H)-pyrimidinone 5'-phosphate reductase